MTSIKTAKRALIFSVLATFLCVAMLVGTTFAWFTDSATTGTNQIQAGNLDVKLMYSKDMVTWKEATAETQLFDNNALWAPGHTEYIYLKIVNNGTLNLKYSTEFAHNYNVSRGMNVLGNRYYVGDYLKIGTAQVDAAFADDAAAQAAIAANEKALKKGVHFTEGLIPLAAGASTDPFAMVVYMPASVGNEANAKSKTFTSKITGIGIQVTAIQDVAGAADFELVTKRVEYTGGTHEITGKIQAAAKDGAIHILGGTTTIKADSVFAVERERYAMAVYAVNNAAVTIESGDFRQQITGDSTQYDLIYAADNAQITIKGGTFKCVTPKWTLNCKDGSNAKITVMGGSFYQFDPSNAQTGEGEVVVAAGYHVVQNGDWYTVVAD